MGAIRYVRLPNGKRIAQHDSANDVLNPRWDDVYAAQEIDGKTVARCIIVAHRENWELGVTEDGNILIGAQEGRVYSMPLEVAENLDQLLGPALPEARALVEEKRRGRGAVGEPVPHGS